MRIRSNVASLAITAILAVGLPAAGTAGPVAADPTAACKSAAVRTPVDALRGQAVDFVLIDASTSTHSASVRAAYRPVAEAVLARAEQKRSAFVLATFVASSSSVDVVYAGTFDPRTGDDLRDLAARNLARCQAKLAIRRTLPVHVTAPALGSGSDVSGAIAGATEIVRPVVARRVPVTLTMLTDGYIAPAPSGPNRRLFNLEAELDRGRSPREILRAHREQIVVADARGLAIDLRGLDRRGDLRKSNTVRARRLVAFWRAACAAMRAKSCNATTALT